MNLRKTIIAAAVALAVAALILKFPGSAQDQQDCAGQAPCGGAAVEEPSAVAGSTEAMMPRTPAAAGGDRSGDLVEGDSGSPDSSWEQLIVKDGSIDSLVLVEFTDDANFDDLVAELRSRQSSVGSERRAEFETLVYAHPNSLDGSVSLDVIECGAMICAADLRSANGGNLDTLIREVTESEAFAGRVIAELPGSEVYSDGVSRRLVFPHDAAVIGVVAPDDVSWGSAVEEQEN